VGGDGEHDGGAFMTNHPETAEEMKKMHEQDPKKWGREMKPKWDAAP